MRSLAAIGLALAGLVIVLSLVASISVTTATEIVPAQGGTFIEGLVGRPGPLNPLLSPTNPCDRDVAALVFSGLTRRDASGKISPDLAERWEASADARVYTFTLTAQAHWHDGAPVLADDVVYTVKALQSSDPTVAPWLKTFWQGVSADKVSERVVRLTLPQPYAPFLQYTTVGLLPAHILAGRGESGSQAFAAHPIGTGPYKLIEQTNEHTVLDAAGGDGRTSPMIPRLEFRYYPDQDVAIAALKTGAIMSVADIGQRAAQLGGQQDITVYWAPRASQTVILFNLSLPFFDDADVRRALLGATDRPALVQSVLKGKGQAGQGIFLSSSWASTDNAAASPADINAARSLLDKAGWVDSNKDGVRERNGIRLEFALLTDTDADRIAAAQAVAQAWTEAGAAVEVQVTSPTALVQDYLQLRRFEAVLFGLDGIADDPDPYEMWHSSQIAPAGLNFTGFSSQKVDEMLEEARRTGDQTRRKQIYTAFQSALNELVPGFVLYEPMFAYAISADVRAVRISFITDPADRFRHLAEWYTKTRTLTSTQKLRIR